jgi:hypothetical protein
MMPQTREQHNGTTFRNLHNNNVINHSPIVSYNNAVPHQQHIVTHPFYSSRVLAIQALQEEIESLRKDINGLKKMVAEKEFEILVFIARCFVWCFTFDLTCN